MSEVKKPDDTEDKSSWHEYGKSKEMDFLKEIGPKLSMDIKINPEKEHNDGAIDFIINGKLSDLKKQETPFFKAGVLFGIDPQYCVTFNTKDYWNYTTNYSAEEIDIIFWVEWKIFEKFGISIQKMHGVWIVSMEIIKNWVNQNTLPTNRYIRRREDQRGNAKTSYLLDLRKMKLLACFEGPCQNSEEKKV